MKKFAWMAGLLLVTACSHVDTGQVDYRIAEPEGALHPCPESQSTNLRDNCVGSRDPIQPARLMRRYMPSNDQNMRPFARNEIFSIEIEQGVIGSLLLEGVFFGVELGNAAEYAILANVFEFAGTEEESQDASRRFVDGFSSIHNRSPEAGDTDSGMKLIYYSEDVQRRQPFNFSNIPLRPRAQYQGGSIGIQIVVIEVDSQSGPTSALFSRLAQFGQSALPQAPGVGDVLSDLGQSIFAGSSGDDILLDYRFVLSHQTASPTASGATFAPGRYVIRRAQNRQRPMDWDNLRLDHNTGRLYRREDGRSIELRDEFYLTLNIRRYAEGTNPEFYNFQNWTTFRNQLQQIAEDRNTPLNLLGGRVDELLRFRRSGQIGAELSQQWSDAVASLRRYERSYASDMGAIDFARCGVTQQQAEARRDNSESAARRLVSLFVNTYSHAHAQGLNPPPGGDEQGAGGQAESEFSDTDRGVIVAQVGRYFTPWTATAPRTIFQDAESFQAEFISNGATGALSQTAVDRAVERVVASRRNRESSILCEELGYRRTGS